MAERLEVRLNEWDDGWHWTVFDADPDFTTSQVEGTLVPYSLGGPCGSGVKALRAALKSMPAGLGETEIVVPAAIAAAWAIICSVDHGRERTGGRVEVLCWGCGESWVDPDCACTCKPGDDRYEDWHVRCATCHGEGVVDRVATPEEVDQGCELGIAFDPCPSCSPVPPVEEGTAPDEKENR